MQNLLIRASFSCISIQDQGKGLIEILLYSMEFIDECPALFSVLKI